MAAGITKISDVVVPERFTPYIQQMTEEKHELIDSGLVVRNPLIDELLAGGGLTFEVPSWKPLDRDDDNVGSDDDGTASTPRKIETAQETAVRLSRNQSWSAMNLASALAGADPLARRSASIRSWYLAAVCSA